MARPVENKAIRRRPRDGQARTEPRESTASVVYGLGPVLEALRSDSRKVERVAIADGAREHRLTEIIDLSREQSIPFARVSRERLERDLDRGANHQGVVAFTSASAYAEIENVIDASENPLILIIDGVEDPRNLGAILRVVECAGADGVIIPERRAVGLTETVAKSSAGAIEHVKVAKVNNLNRLIEDLKARNIWVVGASGDATTTIYDWDWRQPTALVLGSEGSGLHRLVAENCDLLVKVPMYGKIDSLNVSVAAGVILFEAKRQRSSGLE